MSPWCYPEQSSRKNDVVMALALPKPDLSSQGSPNIADRKDIPGDPWSYAFRHADRGRKWNMLRPAFARMGCFKLSDKSCNSNCVIVDESDSEQVNESQGASP